MLSEKCWWLYKVHGNSYWNSLSYCRWVKLLKMLFSTCVKNGCHSRIITCPAKDVQHSLCRKSCQNLWVVQFYKLLCKSTESLVFFNFGTEVSLKKESVQDNHFQKELCTRNFNFRTEHEASILCKIANYCRNILQTHHGRKIQVV